MYDRKRAAVDTPENKATPVYLHCQQSSRARGGDGGSLPGADVEDEEANEKADGTEGDDGDREKAGRKSGDGGGEEEDAREGEEEH